MTVEFEVRTLPPSFRQVHKVAVPKPARSATWSMDRSVVSRLATVLPLEDAAKAHELGETNRATDKIVLTVFSPQPAC